MGDNRWRNVASWTNEYGAFPFDLIKERDIQMFVATTLHVDLHQESRDCLCLSHDYKRNHLAVWEMNKVRCKGLKRSVSPHWTSMHAKGDVKGVPQPIYMRVNFNNNRAYNAALQKHI